LILNTYLYKDDNLEIFHENIEAEVIDNKLKYIENMEIYTENLPCVSFLYAHHYLVTAYCIYHSY